MVLAVRTQLPAYTAGTVAGNSGSPIVTGTNTSWIATDPTTNLQYPAIAGGDQFITPTVAIPIQSVNSSTQITLEFNLPTTINAGTPYRIIRYSPNITGTLLSQLAALQSQGSDATPDLSRTIDNGAGRLKLRVGAAGDLQVAVGPSGTVDAALVTAIDVSQAGAVTINGSAPALTSQLANRNAVLNGNFSINQRFYASGTALAAGAYAHDRFKAGSNGCTYTFTQTVPDTTVTITAGTLIQAVDAPKVYSTSYWLTWTGTATARVWQGSASGNYGIGTSMTINGIAVNALFVTGLSIGTIANIEFSNGTIGLVQFEAAVVIAGSTVAYVGPTRFERRHGERGLCMEYFQTSYSDGTAPGTANVTSQGFFFIYTGSSSTYAPLGVFPLPVAMRAAPTVTIYSSKSGASGMYYNNSADAPATAGQVTSKLVSIYSGNTSVTNGTFVFYQYTASAEI